ncbi:MAG: FAD:protein FMN transferase [Anaerolineaceae bacterium]|nr:FAD:protein FMN transferase [Anaerolineaceae bacterium]
MESMHFKAMGTDIHALMDMDEETAWQAFEQVPLWFEEWEQCLSRFLESSELSRINRQPDLRQKVSVVFGEVLSLALETEKRSESLITPAILPALQQMGYDRSFDLLEDDVAEKTPQVKTSEISSTGLIWEEASRQLVLPAGMQLDFGGVAKGWAAHQAAQRLAAYGPVLINAGGDIAISGMRLNQQPWLIGVRNPFDREMDFGMLPVLQGGVATSGIDHRSWHQNGKLRHHLIDPQTGVSAESDLVQVTILAPDVMQAERAAKQVFFYGSQKGMAWLAQHPQFGAILIREDGDISQTNNIALEGFEELRR